MNNDEKSDIEKLIQMYKISSEDEKQRMLAGPRASQSESAPSNERKRGGRNQDKEDPLEGGSNTNRLTRNAVANKQAKKTRKN